MVLQYNSRAAKHSVYINIIYKNVRFMQTELIVLILVDSTYISRLL